MLRVATFILFCFLFTSVYAQDTVFYKNNALPAKSMDLALTYGLLERDSEDPNQVIETKFTTDKRIISRTFYKDYSNRIKHGQQMFWNEHSKLAITKQYRNDSLHGYWREYTHQGKLARETLYYNGKLAKDSIFPTDTADLKLDSNYAMPEYRWMQFEPLIKDCQYAGNRDAREFCTSRAIRKFILENTRRPIGISETDNEAKVFVGLTIDVSGNIAKIRVLPETKASYPFQQEAMRVLLSLPELIPASRLGEVHPVDLTIPVSFGVEQNEYADFFDYNSLISNQSIFGMVPRQIREQNISNQLVDRMPIWIGCQLKGFAETQDDCTEWRLERFIRKNVKYPVELKSEKPEDVYIVNFDVDEYGKVGNLEVLQRIGGGYEEMYKAAEEVVQSIPDFIPAEKNGKPVSFQLSVAVRFKY